MKEQKMETTLYKLLIIRITISVMIFIIVI